MQGEYTQGPGNIPLMTDPNRTDPEGRDQAGDTADVALARSQAQMAEIAAKHGSSPQEGKPVVLGIEDVSVSYSGSTAIRDVNLTVHKGLVTAFIGPSGCGKTTLLRSLNRMNDLIPGAVVSGTIQYHGHDLNAAGVDAGRGAAPDRDGVPAAEPVPQVDLRQRRLRPAPARNDRQPQGSGRERVAPGGALGRGAHAPQVERPFALRRPAAAPLHRPGAGHRARRRVDGRARLGTRPDRHAEGSRIWLPNSRTTIRL